MAWYLEMMGNCLSEFQNALYNEDYKRADESIAAYHDYRAMAGMLAKQARG